MHETQPLSRRSVLLGTATVAGGALLAGPAAGAAEAAGAAHHRRALWKDAAANGLAFGSSVATWQLDDQYRHVHGHEAAVMFTEDDLLWYRLKPSLKAPINFSRGDRMVQFAERHYQLIIGAHLAWDEGFGEGWTEDELFGLKRQRAERLLYGVISKEVGHYRGRMDGWIVANEVTDPESRDKHGFRTNVPWYQTIGPSYIAHSFHLAKEHDPHALRIINEFGFETVNDFGDRPGPRKRAFLTALDRLLDQNVPVQAVGIQGHLLAHRFAERFHEHKYRRFLREIADRGLHILITEMDIMDDGLPKNPQIRDREIADIYRRYLDVTLDEKAVKAVIAFGLTDRYTWLQEDFPRDDGAQRRPLAFDTRMDKKPAYFAISHALRHAPQRKALWHLEKFARP